MHEILSVAQGSLFHMWFVLFLIFGTIVAYSIDKIPLELTSIVIFAVMLIFFNFFPLIGSDGSVQFDTSKILLGFSNPALITVMGLLVVGQSVVQTGALNEIANVILKLSKNNARVAILVTLIFITCISAVLNNTPVVVIFIPILAVIAKKVNVSVSKVMIPLSYVAILGGMTTLLGSSTNVLISGTLVSMGLEPLGFFDFTIPGVIIAVISLLYVILIVPKLLPDRASFAKAMIGDDERHFIAQVEIDRTSDFVGKKIENSSFPDFPSIAVRMVQRGEHAFLPPFEENMTIRSRDIIIVAATRKDLTGLLTKEPSTLLQGGSSQDGDDGDEMKSGVNIAEVVITPSSRMIGRNLEQVGFHSQHNCVVLGIQRQARVIRARVSEIRLAAGDVLLVMGKKKDIMALQENKDFLLLEWSTEEIHSGQKARQAALVLGLVVSLAAFEVIPIAVTSFVGAAAVILMGCLNLRQAKRAMDAQILFIIATSLALGSAMQATGAASYIAHLLVNSMHGSSPVAVMSVLFVLMMSVTNLLSNNACGVLFTPIAVGAANELGVPPEMFIFAVVFACNSSFITPIGYQTNLLVMGPGHYKFSDYMRAGLPLSIIIWIIYTAFASWYFV